MVRKISKNRYVIAFLLTIFIFIFGLLLGLYITEKRVEFVQDLSQQQRLDYDSLQLQYLYLNTLEDKNCIAVTKTLEDNIDKLEQTRKKLESYILSSLTKDEDLELIKREYMLAELRYWLLSESTKDICQRDTVSILYFYSNNRDKCPDCSSQGSILTYLKDKFKDRLLIFSLDADFKNEPLLLIFKESNNITKTPTLIVKNKKFEGLVKLDILTKEICSYYKEKPPIC